jgi:purine-cytosine permease-like protein
MTSTDETQGEDVYGVDADSSHTDEFAPPRRRRSTYTPPPQYRDTVAPPQPVAAQQPVATPTVQSPAAGAPAPQVNAVHAAPHPSYTVYSIDDGSLDDGSRDAAPAGSAPADQPQHPVQTPVWTAPVDNSSAPATAIPDWSTQAPTSSIDQRDARRLTPPPAWTPPVEPPAAPPFAPAAQLPNSDVPADAPVEATSPYRPWTPDSHVDADAYWNTARRASSDTAAGDPASSDPLSSDPASSDPAPGRPAPVAPALPEPLKPVQFVPATPAPVDEPYEPDIAPGSSAPVWSLDDEPAADRYRPWVPEPQPDTTPLWDALFPSGPPTATPPTADSTPAPPASSGIAPASEPVLPAASEPAPPAASGFMTPDDEAATLAAHAPPAGQPWIPQRRSLPDDQLLSVLEAADSKPGGTLDAMDALENEMRLREVEVQEYREWEDSMLAVGTPEALAVVAQVRPEFTAIEIPAELTPTSAIPIQYPDAQPAEPSKSARAQSDAPWPFSEPGEPEVPLLPAPTEPSQPTPAEPWVPTAPEVPAQPEEPSQPEEPAQPDSPLEPEAPAEPAAPAEPTAPAEHEREEPHDSQVAHDMPQSWFDALVAPAEQTPAPPAQAPQTVAVAQPTGYPVPKFDELIAVDPEAHPGDEPADDAPEVKPKRPFGVAVADGHPQHPDPAPNSEAPAAPGRLPLFALEQAGDRPTPRDLRTGRASRMFWLWFAANSSVVSIGMGATVFSLGMSLRQSIVAALAGTGLSLVPLGLGTLAGKRSGQPTMIVSRAVFGLVGNVVPAALAFVSRVFWGAVLLWLFAASLSAVVAGGTGSGDRSTAGLVVVFIVVGVMLAAVVAFLGYWLLARVQLVVSVVSAALIAGFVALTWQRVDFAAALTVADGPWIRVVTGAVAVFSFLGLVWANSASDLARYQRPGGSSAAHMLGAGFGATLPSFLLVGYGALLAASDQALGARIVADPVGALTGILPAWYPVPLVVATGLSLLSGVIITAYSGAFALQAAGLRVERQWATLIVGAVVAVLAVGFSLLDVDLVGIFRDLATTVAVPVAAWAGIFAADTMIRNRPFHTASLLRIGGVYPRVHPVNVGALVVITAIGWGLTTATVAGLGWQGYVFAVAGVDTGGDLAASDLGVLVALVLGLLTPLVTGVRTIRRQEADQRPI